MEHIKRDENTKNDSFNVSSEEKIMKYMNEASGYKEHMKNAISFEDSGKRRWLDAISIQKAILKDVEVVDYLHKLAGRLKGGINVKSEDHYQVKPFPERWIDPTNGGVANVELSSGQFHAFLEAGSISTTNNTLENDQYVGVGIGTSFIAPGSGTAEFAAMGSYHYKIGSRGVDFDVKSTGSIFMNVFDNTTSSFVVPRTLVVDAINYYHDYPLWGEHGTLDVEDFGSFAYNETHRQFNIETGHKYTAWIYTNANAFAHVGNDFVWSESQTWLDVTVALIHIRYIGLVL
jgi:hypothetical protein